MESKESDNFTWKLILNGDMKNTQHSENQTWN